MTQTNYSPGPIVFTLHAFAAVATHSACTTNRLDTTGDTCNLCQAAPHTIKHIMGDYAVLAPLKQEHIMDERDLWVAPGRSIGYLRAVGLFEQN